MLRAKEQVFKKQFEILTRSVDAFLQIVVVCTDKRVGEYQEFAANTSLFTAKPKVFKYFTMKTAVARVLPSQKGWICQMPDANFAMCLIDSGTESAS